MRALHCKVVDSCFFSRRFARLVGAGLALPFARRVERGQGKPSPYKRRLIAAPPPCATFPSEGVALPVATQPKGG